MWITDDVPFRRFLRFANSLVAGCCALILHLSRTGVLVLAATVAGDATTFTPGTCTGGGSDIMIAVTNGSTWSCH